MPVVRRSVDDSPSTRPPPAQQLPAARCRPSRRRRSVQRPHQPSELPQELHRGASRRVARRPAPSPHRHPSGAAERGTAGEDRRVTPRAGRGRARPFPAPASARWRPRSPARVVSPRPRPRRHRRRTGAGAAPMSAPGSPASQASPGRAHGALLAARSQLDIIPHGIDSVAPGHARPGSWAIGTIRSADCPLRHRLHPADDGHPPTTVESCDDEPDESPPR